MSAVSVPAFCYVQVPEAQQGWVEGQLVTVFGTVGITVCMRGDLCTTAMAQLFAQLPSTLQDIWQLGDHVSLDRSTIHMLDINCSHNLNTLCLKLIPECRGPESDFSNL